MERAGRHEAGHHMGVVRIWRCAVCELMLRVITEQRFLSLWASGGSEYRAEAHTLSGGEKNSNLLNCVGWNACENEQRHANREVVIQMSLKTTDQ